MKTKRIVTGLLATALIAAPMAPALAHDNRPPPRPAKSVEYRHDNRHNNGNDVAVGLFAGLAALTTLAVIANANQAPPPRPVHYVAPEPVYRYAQPRRTVVYTYPTAYRVAPTPVHYHGTYYAR